MASSAPSGDDGRFKIFVGNLTYDTTEDDLKSAFASFGEIEFCRINTDKMSGKPAGYGFITFMTKESGEAAISAMNGTDLKGREMKVGTATPRDAKGGKGEENSRSNNCFIGNLADIDPESGQEALKEWFDRLCPPKQTRIIKDPATGNSR